LPLYNSGQLEALQPIGIKRVNKKQPIGINFFILK
jgi:hypothetical protein